MFYCIWHEEISRKAFKAPEGRNARNNCFECLIQQKFFLSENFTDTQESPGREAKEQYCMYVALLKTEI